MNLIQINLTIVYKSYYLKKISYCNATGQIALIINAHSK